MKGMFLGPTKGNSYLTPDRTSGSSKGATSQGGSLLKGFAAGPCKGNKDLPPNRTANTPGGMGGGAHKAGGMRGR